MYIFIKNIIMVVMNEFSNLPFYKIAEKTVKHVIIF